MKETEIMNATPEQLRVMVAKALGWNTEHLRVEWAEGSTPDGLDGWEGWFCPRCGSAESDLDAVPCCPDWPNDIAKALELAETLDGLDGINLHRASVVMDGPRRWHCSLILEQINAGAEGPTAAIAVCRAWLIAVSQQWDATLKTLAER